MINISHKLLLTFLFAISLLVPNFSYSQIIDSSFYNWKVYELQEDELSSKLCYIVSYPTNSDSDDLSRKKPYFMVARFQRQRSEEVSIFGGFEYKLNSKVLVAIDDNNFQFFAREDTAWTKDRGEDIAVIKALLNSGRIMVRSNSAIGTFGVDEYSLKGITKAYARMREICK